MNLFLLEEAWQEELIVEGRQTEELVYAVGWYCCDIACLQIILYVPRGSVAWEPGRWKYHVEDDNEEGVDDEDDVDESMRVWSCGGGDHYKSDNDDSNDDDDKE